MKQYVIALDQGTTSSRAILFDREQNIIAMGQKEFPQHYPKAGYVEHDPMEIYSSQYGVMVEVLAKSNVQPEEIAAIGITNQRETTIVWDKETGRPIYNAIVWQCRRTAPLCEELKRRGLEDYIRERTGLLHRCLFFRHQDQVDPGQCAGCPPDGQGRPSALRHGGYLADLEADRRARACDRLHQRQPHHAV